MTRRLPVLSIWLAALPLTAQGPTPDVAIAAPATDAAHALGSKLWVGRHAEFEDFLRTGRIERVNKIPVGVTKPERGFFAPGGLAMSAVVKHLSMGRRAGFCEARKEIAAYELKRRDRIVAHFERLAQEKGEAAVYPF